MKKCIVQAHLNMSEEKLANIAIILNKQWDEGLMVLPFGFSAEVVDDTWIPVDKALPKEGQAVLIWYEYHDDGELAYSYGFGWIENNYWTTHTECEAVLAWMSLPEPYSKE